MTEPSKSSISFSEFFGKAVTLYTENFMPLVNFSFACTAVMVLKSLLDTTTETGTSLLAVILSPIFFAVNTFFLMCLTYMVSSLAVGKSLTPGDVMQYVWEKFLRGMGGYLLISLLALAGLLLLIVPGIYVITVFNFFIFAILIDDKGVLDSFKYSRELVHSRFWKVLAANALVFAVAFLFMVPIALGGRMMGLANGVLVVIIGVVGALAMPVFVGFYYFIYEALKVEREGVVNISVHP
jgi:hypothetical protein